ncbi:MAG: tRNA (guanosine(46)-N7)-methyltransferase TrmB [Anaerolineae bacterium]|nr:tRNA (guanosine(46)-N7)-methyltransferase TrmB [Anaerolineae bacterium]
MVGITLDAFSSPWPVDWTQEFGRPAPLVLEIGFGNGDFLIHQAQSRPQTNFIGLEVSLPSLKKAERKVHHAGLTNVRVLHNPANMVLWLLLRPQTLDGLYLNFPDPWPKHILRRVVNDQFLHLAASRMKPGAFLDIATDHPDYIPWVIEHLERTPYFSSRRPTSFVTEDDERFRTKYEQIALAEGRVCYYFHWQRNEAAAADLFPIPQEKPMPHVILHSPLPPDELARQFQQQRHQQGEMFISLDELFQSARTGALLVETYIHESALTQRVGLTIHQREAGRYIIGLHELGFPRPTPGVQFAIYTLAQWLCSLHPASHILSHNLNPDVGERLASLATNSFYDSSTPPL